MTITIIAFIVLSIILFILLNLAAREMFVRVKEMKKQADREAALAEHLRLDFTRESKTLKRVEVEEPVARILCVDDEEVILNSFRKILVLDGYNVDTVETGQEVLGLIQSNDYDFVFTDLKMPAMSGTDVAKSVKHLRPDIDVVIITGYATVETAVECMKYGAMDYVEKPFTEDELRRFTRHALIKRRNRIEMESKPRVHVIGPDEPERGFGKELSIPGGVLVSSGHCWASLEQDGTVQIGIDDFAGKLIGRIDKIDFPRMGTAVKAGEPLFNVHQDEHRARFRAPLSGKVIKINEQLQQDYASLQDMAYGEQWICVIEADDLDAEMPALKIGKSAVALFQEDIERFYESLPISDAMDASDPVSACMGAFERLNKDAWNQQAEAFFDH